MVLGGHAQRQFDLAPQVAAYRDRFDSDPVVLVDGCDAHAVSIEDQRACRHVQRSLLPRQGRLHAGVRAGIVAALPAALAGIVAEQHLA